MDKYTIDLDQLLDDFEYSELTDNSGRDRPPTQERLLKGRIHPKDLSTKHSINNVFHSLNEYLSSNISSTNKVVFEEGHSSNVKIDNNLISNKENITLDGNDVLNETPQLKLLTNNTEVDEDNKVNDNIHEASKENICQLNGKNEKTENLLEISENLVSMLPEFTENYTENVNNFTLNTEDGGTPNICMDSNFLQDEITSEIKNDTEAVKKEDKKKEKEGDNVVFDNKLSNENHNVIEKDYTNSEENSIVDSDKGTIENMKPNGQNEEYLSLIDNMEHESTEEDNSIESKFAETLIIDNKSAVKSIETEDNFLHKVKCNNTVEDLIVESIHDTTNIDCEDNKIEDFHDVKRCESPKVVGFSQDIDVDDSELAKMLEELEGDDELEQDLQSVSNDKNGSGELEDPKTVDQEIEDCENINNLNEEIEQTWKQTKKVEEEISHCDQPIVLKSYDETFTHEVEEPKAELTRELSKVLSIPKEMVLEKDKKNQVKKEKDLEEKLDINAVQPEVEQTYVEILEDSLETNPSSLESSQNSDQNVKSSKPQRPQDLPLNNLKTQEEKARKINLIGSPGSTPYNNVYINKTGSKRHKNEEESEGEYSTSPSPTFSDVSTDSTSTASTVSIEDIERSKNMIKNVNVEKENNLEKEAKSQSLQESRVQGAGESLHNDNQSAEEARETVQNLANEENVQSPEVGQGESHGNIQDQWTGPYSDKSWLGKEAPLWIPDADASACLHCDMKFTMIKRRHHCRACGLVLCSKCCNLKFRLEYLDADARVCQKCFDILSASIQGDPSQGNTSTETEGSPSFRPNPNNPLEYCSTVSPLQQVEQTGGSSSNPPSVMVPVGVLKRKGSNKSKHNKSVMFCDGIAPGSDLTNLDKDFDYQDSKTLEKSEVTVQKSEERNFEKNKPVKVVSNYPKVDSATNCFIPSADDGLPPIVDVEKFLISNAKPELVYTECTNSQNLVEKLKSEKLCFAITTQLFVNVNIINMNCCINKTAWCFSTEGLINVGNDEIVYLLEFIEDESCVPKDIFFHIHNIYLDAAQGNSVKELGVSLHTTSNFLDSKNHAGFIYLKPTFQCLENVIIPKEPSFLVGLLIHRWETPWAKLFPLRLILRLGAEYRYYPSPIISARHRDSLFVEIGHTIINLLADFRNYSYTLPQIRGLMVHMEDKNTTITIPKNRYDQVTKAITTAPDHILAFAGNFSMEADSHLVCIQDTQDNQNNYTTHAINIHNKPRKITGASFIIFNGSLKPNAGFKAKSNIIEDGLMIQILPEHMVQIRDSLRSMKDHTVICGAANSTTAEETVKIVWGENDADFNLGICSPVDLLDMKGIPSIRVHNGKDYVSNTGTRVIRWTEVFILQNTEDDSKNQDPIDISKVSESIAKASCNALVNYLELLLSNSCSKIGIRVTLQADNVSYLAGNSGKTLPPIYMKSLDDELIPILHKLTSNSLGDHVIVLELIFRILAA